MCGIVSSSKSMDADTDVDVDNLFNYAFMCGSHILNMPSHISKAWNMYNPHDIMYLISKDIVIKFYKRFVKNLHVYAHLLS